MISKVIVCLPLIFIFYISSFSQNVMLNAADPCFHDEAAMQRSLKKLGPGWGYNFDSLLTDLEQWSASPFVQIDSAGASVQGRTLYTLQITDTSVSDVPRTRISIHARTHPGEVQSSWVTNQMIDYLLSDSVMARQLRSHCIFNIMPMYNPDGVELGYGRKNANGIDLEGNWDKSPHEPETATLKRLFEEYMANESPVRVALNMHSSSDGSRFFVYHHPSGTSNAFAEDEIYYIESVRNYWIEGIREWDYFVSWDGYTPTHYPESWFWINYQEAVMALTYEDIYGNEDQQEFRRAAQALLFGTYDYLFKEPQEILESPNERIPAVVSLFPNYPNPFNNHTRLRFYLQENSTVDITIYSLDGAKISKINLGYTGRGFHTYDWSPSGMPSGLYIYKILAGDHIETSRMMVIK